MPFHINTISVVHGVVATEPKDPLPDAPPPPISLVFALAPVGLPEDIEGALTNDHVSHNRSQVTERFKQSRSRGDAGPIDEVVGEPGLDVALGESGAGGLGSAELLGGVAPCGVGAVAGCSFGGVDGPAGGVEGGGVFGFVVGEQ